MNLLGRKRKSGGRTDFSSMDLVSLQEFVSVIEETEDWDSVDFGILVDICARLREIALGSMDSEAVDLELFILDQVRSRDLALADLDDPVVSESRLYSECMRTYLSAGFRKYWQAFEEDILHLYMPGESTLYFPVIAADFIFLRHCIAEGSKEAEDCYSRVVKKWSVSDRAFTVKLMEILDGLDISKEWNEQEFRTPPMTDIIPKVSSHTPRSSNVL